MTQPQDPHEPVEPTEPIPPAADQESSDQQPDYPPPPPPAPASSQPASSQPASSQPASSQPASGPPAYSQPAYSQPAYGQGGFAPGIDPAAPYGVHPVTGVPYSDKSKLVAGLLQLLIPLGIGRMYIGDTRTGVIQLVVTIVTCGLGALWPFIDGILMLVGDPVDSLGRPLRT